VLSIFLFTALLIIRNVLPYGFKALPILVYGSGGNTLAVIRTSSPSAQVLPPLQSTESSTFQDASHVGSNAAVSKSGTPAPVTPIPEVQAKKAEALKSPVIALPPVSFSNSLPDSGFSKQKIRSDTGDFSVSLIVINGDTARLIVDTAGDADCYDNCPVMPLAEHVSRNGGFAGINGGYFCPPDYSWCSGKVNTFDTLVMNKNKTLFNFDKNYRTSAVPLLVMDGGVLTFYDRTSEWTRDEGKSGVIANHPMLLRGNRVVANEPALEEKLKERGTKGFIGKRNNKIVIGHVFSATTFEEEKVLEALGLEEALNLDGGGSSALWYEGSYRVGPGRQLPAAIVFIRK